MTDELVRDKVPEILKLQGLNPDYDILPAGHGMRRQYARQKFVNVSGEVDLALKLAKPEDILAALGKMMDMVSVVATEHGITMKQVRESRDHVRALKGEHKEFVILKNPNRI